MPSTKRDSWIDRNKGFILTLIVVLAGMLGGYYAVKARADSNTEKISKCEAVVDTISKKDNQQSSDIAVIKEQMKNVQGDMQELKTDVKEFQRETNDKLDYIIKNMKQ